MSADAKKRFWDRYKRLRLPLICAYCKIQVSRKVPHNDPRRATIDHYTPLSKGGSNRRGNLILACLKCNQEKAANNWDEKFI